MSRLADLIAQLCPDGVEYQPLSELVRIRNGCDYKMLSSGNVPVYGSGGVMTHVSEALGEGPTVLIPRKGSLDNIFFVEGKFWTVDTIFYTEIASDLDPKFFYYKMKTMHLSQMNEAAGVPSMNQKKLGRILIPVPPLEVQREIVRILDQFTTLEVELEAELEVRQAQYEYYRNHLLSYESMAARGPFSWIPLRELGVWSGGGTPSKSRADYWDEGNIPWITPKDMRSSKIQNSMMNVTDRAVREPNVKLIEAPSIALVVRSSILQHTFPIAQIDVDATFNQDMKALVVDIDRFEHRYIYYALSANGQEILRQTSKQGGSVNSLVVPRLMDFEIPVPTLDEQRRIADLLDRFDALVNDITSGLPAEIAARRAQYEHYRDRLLSFPEKKAE